MEITRQSITMNRNRNRNSFIFHAFPLWLYSLHSESLQIFRRAKNFNIFFFLSPKTMRDSGKQCFRNLSVRSVNRAREKRSATNLWDHCSTIYFISIEKIHSLQVSRKVLRLLCCCNCFFLFPQIPRICFYRGMNWSMCRTELPDQFIFANETKLFSHLLPIDVVILYALPNILHVRLIFDCAKKPPLQYEYSNNERKNNINKQRKII